MGVPGDLPERIAALRPEEHRSLGVLAVVAPASLAVDEVSRLAEVASSLPALTALAQQGLVRREPSGRWSLAPESAARLKRLLAGLDTTDRVLRGFIGIAEDGRLDMADLDAVVELTRIAAETGRWSELLRLAEAAQTALSTTHRVEEWVEIVERRLEAARVVGDTAAMARAQAELARLAETSDARPPPPGPSTPGALRWLLAIAAVVVAVLVGLGVGYLVGNSGGDDGGAGSGATTLTVTAPVTTEVTTPGQTVTETQTETITETVTETTTVTETVETSPGGIP
jgi:hypothetical protein